MTAFDNFQTRETSIWPPFICYGSYNTVQAEERPIIFGLYSNSHRNNSGYLQGVSDFQLAMILSDYNNKIAALSNDELMVVNDLIAKKYISDIEGLIHDEKMITKQQEIDASLDEWDAKIAALSADRAALETLRVKIDAGIKKINARILELQAYIQIETLNLAMVDIEIDEKTLALSSKNLELAVKALDDAKKDIDLLNVANEIAKVQLQIVESGFKLIDVDMEVARTEVNISQTEVQIAKAGMAEDELAVAVARTAVETAELSTYDSKVALAQAGTTLVNNEIANVGVMTTDEYNLYQARIATEGYKYMDRVQALENQTERQVFGIQDRDISAELLKTIQVSQNEADEDIDDEHIKANDARVNAASVSRWAAIEAVNRLKLAEVTTKLTHTIGKVA